MIARPALFALAILPVDATAQSNVSLHDQLCGRTTHSYYGGGNQIEYMRADGSGFFWRYGRSDSVGGQWWVVENQLGGEDVCFRYEAGAFSPVSPLQEHCTNGTVFMNNLIPDGLRDGDPYDLESGDAPFYLIARPLIPTSNLARQFPDQPRDGACNGAFLSM